MKTKILIFILLVAAALRFYKLDSYPVSLSWDEAAIGYNAYSIAKTGYDEYGKKYPTLFQSFNDFKLPGYIYTDSLFVRAFGLSEFSVRFPSALFGLVAVLLIYLLIKEITNQNVALAAAFLMAISPWHLQFSRAAFEANAALTIVLMGTVFLVYGLRNRFFALLSLPILSLSIYFYYSPRIFVPLTVVAFAAIYKKELAKNLKYFLFGALISALIILPIAVKILSPQGLKRVQEVSIFSDRSIIEPYVKAKAMVNNPLSPVFLNRRIPRAFEALHGYFSHFSPGFLFFGDDPNPRHKSVFHGNLYLTEIPLLVIGFWQLLKGKNKSKYFIISWLLIAPIPAGLAKEFPHGLRALLMLPAVVTISAFGLNQALKFKYMKLVIPLVFVLSIANYLFTYYIVYPRTNSSSWAYGYSQALSQTAKLENSYDRIIFTGSLWKPYIFYLFQNKIDPAFYSQKSSAYYRESNQESIGKYRFGVAAWDGGKNLDDGQIENLKSGKTLVVISPQELVGLKSKEKFHPLQTIYDFAGDNEVFKIGEWQ